MYNDWYNDSLLTYRHSSSLWISTMDAPALEIVLLRHLKINIFVCPAYSGSEICSRGMLVRLNASLSTTSNVVSRYAVFQ